MRHLLRFSLIAVAVAACATPNTIERTPPPDALKRVAARNAAVASANVLASDAGIEILRAGGNAVDAAVATAFAVGVVEPQMSGLGGSGAMLIWKQDEGQAYYLDFYAMQNAASFRGHTADGDDDIVDLRIVGIPGEVAGLLAAHERFGTLPLATILAPAIRLADNGYPVGQILAGFIRSDSAKLHRFPAAREQMFPNGHPLRIGDVYRNPQLANTLRAIAERGRAGFDEGTAGRAIVAQLSANLHPASLADLSGFQPQWKRPLCAVYRDRVVLSAPPPQTGAQVIHSLKLLEPFDLASLGSPTQSARAFDVIVSALRVAQADNRGNDDPRWRSIPANGRISEAFAAQRRSLVGTGRAAESIESASAEALDDATPPAECTPYRPWPADAAVALPVENGSRSDTDNDNGETTHLSVVDAAGNAVSLSQTNSTIFGSGAWVAGFFLNDSGYRFRNDSATYGGTSTWRTRTSTISPTIVLEDGRVRMVTGAPGSGRIPTEIVQTMVYVLDYGMDPIEALRMPRIYPSAANPRVQLEHGFAPSLLADIRAMGYDPIEEGSSHARLYMIVRRGDWWIAVSDPRHDGQPRGY